VRRAPALLALLATAGTADAQTLLDQELRLIEIHALLLALPPVGAPGALGAGQVGLGLELVTIPPIDGATGSRRQITASDRTPLFPRPRIVVGLPKRLNGDDTDLTPLVRRFVTMLAELTGLPVDVQDERLTSIEAESRLAVRERDWRKRKKLVDAEAASIVLQDYLDARSRAEAARRGGE